MMTSRLSRKESVGLWLHRNLDKRFSRLSVALFRRTKGGITERVNVDALVLTTVGRKSGRRRRVLLQYFRDGDDMLLVAADGGGDRHPGWFHNLMADPDAEAEIRGQAVLVHATKLNQTDAEDAWPAILARSPDYERYLRATERSIPIVRLTRHRPRPQVSDS